MEKVNTMFQIPTLVGADASNGSLTRDLRYQFNVQFEADNVKGL